MGMTVNDEINDKGQQT